jgi:hypothetical protein
MPPLIPGPPGFDTVGSIAQLRSAVSAAQPNASLSLYLPPSSRFELGGTPITVGAIELELASDSPGATLDAQFSSHLLDVQNGARLRLQSLTLANGNSDSNGGAIRFSPGSETTARSILILNSYSGVNGGALFLNGGVVTMASGSSIRNSSCDRYGGAIMLGSGSLIFTTGSSIVSCVGYAGGGVYLTYGTLSIIGGSVMDCTCKRYGGGVWNWGGTTVLNNASIINCQAVSEAGAFGSERLGIELD